MKKKKKNLRGKNDIYPNLKDIIWILTEIYFVALSS